MNPTGLRWKASLGLLLSVTGLPSATAAQQNLSEAFDIDRAWLPDSQWFEPFYATDAQLLRDLLRDRMIHSNTLLMVMEHEAGTLALVTEQMAYHHIAQGDLDGEPWMVSF